MRFKLRNISFFLFLAALIMAAFLSSHDAGAAESFNSKCTKILGNNPGAVIVWDLNKSKPLAVVNPETAYGRAFRPGSIFKIVTASALLRYGNVDPYRKAVCRNYFEIRGRKLICSEPGGHGAVGMAEALGSSCSVYFYRNAPRLTPGELKDEADIFGLGKSLSIPGKKIKCASGIIKPPDDPARFVQFAVGDDEGIKIAPWHALNIAAIVAGKPVSKELRAGLTNFRPSSLSVLRKGMENAAICGTCSGIGKAGIDAAAKTGTSTDMRFKDRNSGWFISYYPAKCPHYTVVVFLEDGRGYIDAVPMGIKILKELEKLNQD